MGMCEAVVQADALPLLDESGVKYELRRKDLYAANAIELASGLCLKAIQSGAAIFSLMMAEDVCVHGRRVTGVVVNRPMIAGVLPVDPIAFSAKAVVDATGHEAVIVESLRKRRLLENSSLAERFGEDPMDAASGECSSPAGASRNLSRQHWQNQVEKHPLQETTHYD